MKEKCLVFVPIQNFEMHVTIEYYMDILTSWYKIIAQSNNGTNLRRP